MQNNTDNGASICKNWLDSSIDDMNINIAMMLRTSKNFPKYSGTVYRGDWMANKHSKFKSNAKITNRSFVSTSTDKGVAHNFLVSNKLGAGQTGLFSILKLNGYSGIDISKGNPGEAEVLLMPGSKFKITKFYKPEPSCKQEDSIKSLEDDSVTMFNMFGEYLNKEQCEEMCTDNNAVALLEELPSGPKHTSENP